MSKGPPDSAGYVMSLSQLNELWHYDMWLAHVLMDVPLRSCTAVPTDSPDFPALDQATFLMLKEQVRTMWILASNYFVCKKSNHGWGIFFSENIRDNWKEFSNSNGVVFGWLARAPAVETCHTGHRYLRSPCRLTVFHEYNIYLGGPISMANFDQVDRVRCQRCISVKEPRRHKISVSKAPGRKIQPGQEVLWSYGISHTEKCSPKFSSQQEWQLDTCCQEVEQDATQYAVSVQPSASPETTEECSSQVKKKRKVGGSAPHKNKSLVSNFKLCTYCGVNVSSLPRKQGTKENMKRHWALKHSVDLCEEMGASPDDPEHPVSPRDFIIHLDKVDHVYNSLHNHNYKIVPACTFFNINRSFTKLDSNATDVDKQQAFCKFLAEGEESFKKYQVLYLKGITMPKKYEDLLEPEKHSNYCHVNWDDGQPSANNFSLNSYDLTEDEKAKHAENIKSQIENLVIGWTKQILP